MIDKEKETPPEEPQTAEESEVEEIVTPRSKYELIMMAAAEASRLNEEIRTKSDEDLRRRGIDVQGMVTIEALKRVREGKVKVVVQKAMAGPKVEPGMPSDLLREGLFFSPAPSERGEEEPGESPEGMTPEESEE